MSRRTTLVVLGKREVVPSLALRLRLLLRIYPGAKGEGAASLYI